jgi:hypothetical protein
VATAQFLLEPISDVSFACGRASYIPAGCRIGRHLSDIETINQTNQRVGSAALPGSGGVAADVGAWIEIAT